MPGAASLTASNGAVSGSAAVTVNFVNQAPTLTLPRTHRTAQPGGIVFSVATGNAITISDAGCGKRDNPSHSHGDQRRDHAGWYARADVWPAVVDSRTGQIVMTGTVADVNAAMNGMLFRPTAQSAELEIAVNDLGHSGFGGPKTASGTVAVTQVLNPLPAGPPVVGPSPPSPAPSAVPTASPRDPRCRAGRVPHADPCGNEAAGTKPAAHARGDLLEPIAAAEPGASMVRGNAPFASGRLEAPWPRIGRASEAAHRQTRNWAALTRAARCGTISTPWTRS